MAYLPVVLGTPLKGKLLERLLRRGPATQKDLSLDLSASRQQVASAVAELHLLGVVNDEPLASDRRARLVSINEQHPFIEPLRVLAIDAAAYFETPETWQDLLIQHYGEDWYIGGYAAIRRVMQPIDFEDEHVLVNLATPEEKLDVPAIMARAAGIKIQRRLVDHVPPEVVPIMRGTRRAWFATPERGFVEAWRLKEISTYGLFLCLIQGLHDGALHPGRILAVAPSEGMENEMLTLLAGAKDHIPLTEFEAPLRPTRALAPTEREALDHAINTVMG